MELVCKTEGCDNLVRSRGLCNRHYEQWRSDKVPCSVQDCDRGARARGMCSMHYFRWRNHGDAGDAELRRKGVRPCKVDTCENQAITRDDLCATHRRKKRLYGNEDGSFATHKTCDCGEAAVAAPRSSDYCRDHYINFIKSLVARGEIRGDINKANGYAFVSIFKKRYSEHSVIMESMIGRALYPFENVHHRNGRRADNRPENLELWVKPQLAGQRVDELIAFIVEHYSSETRAALDA